MLRVCHVIASINRDVGGPSVTVPRLAGALSGLGVACKLLTLDYPHLGPQSVTNDFKLVTLPAGMLTRSLRGWSPAFRRCLEQETQQADLVHHHGVWMFPGLYARKAASQAHVPLVISPRGMLESWSLGRSRVKKLAAWIGFERRNLTSAAMFHATSDAESSSIRDLGFKQPIAVVPNGVDVEVGQQRISRAVLEEKYPQLASQRWLLFLSRIHPKKGIAELLTAWSRLQSEFKDWHLIIAGPDLEGYRANYRNQATKQGLDGRVTFVNALAGLAKEAALSNADLFILPTHSENFGIAVAEALSFGLPVITTKGAPWREIQTYDCGWWITMDDNELVRAMGEAMRLPKVALEEMGRRGRKLVRDHYSWATAAERLKTAYEWLLGRGSRPEWVSTM